MIIADIYKKPDAICRNLTERDNYLLNLSDEEFITVQKKEIEDELDQHGFTIRKANYCDIDPLMHFTDKWYVRLEGNELSAYDYYRFIKFGTGLILEKDEQIYACVFEIAYDGPQRTSYPLRLVLDDSIKGNNFGLLMVLYLSLTAKQRGAEINRSVISFENHVSIYIQVNKQGWILNGVNAKIKGLTDYFEATLPLSKTGVLQNKIDMKKLISFINLHEQGKDYLLVNSDSMADVQEAFTQKYIITAFIRSGIIDKNNYFFAQPASVINYK